MFNVLKMFMPFGMCMEFAEGEGGSLDESGSDGHSDVSDDELDDEGWVAKRGAKSLREELKRRIEETKDAKSLREERETLKAELERLKTQSAPKNETPAQKARRYKNVPHLASFFEKYRAGVPQDKTEEYFEDMLDAMTDTAIGASQFWAGEKTKGVDKYLKRQQEASLKESLKTLGDKKEFKFIATKYGSDIEKAVKEKLSPEDWDNEDKIKSILGTFIANHMSEINDDTSGAVPGTKKVTETDNIGGGANTGSGVSDSDIEEAANIGGFDLGNPDERKQARTLAIARKNRDKAIRDSMNK